MMDYIDKLFESHKQKQPALTKGLTQDTWLKEARNNWRKALRAMGKKAIELQKIDDVDKARAEWVRFTRRNRNEIGLHIAAIPLLKSSHSQAQSDEVAFRDLMKDLATLAKI